MKTIRIGNDDATKARWMGALARVYGGLPDIRYVAAMICDPWTGYEKQSCATAIAAWVRENIRYFREAGEQIQTPLQTLRARIGDCDDLVVLAGALAQAAGLRWAYRFHGHPAQHVDIVIEGVAYELTR